jgi:diacylglycerol kinase (ATP)
MRSVLIVNPKAKRGRALWHAQRAQARLQRHGWHCELQPSENPEHVRQLTERAVATGVDAVLIAGGDGTIHHAVQVLANSAIPLGIIPCGRGNDLVRALGIPLDAEAAAEVIARQNLKAIDLGQVMAASDEGQRANFSSPVPRPSSLSVPSPVPRPSSRFFCGIVTCGFDSEVADFAHRHRQIPGGWVGYFGAALLLLARYRFKTVRVRGDGWSFDGETLLVATANCPAYGGGMWIAPTAKLDDGLLHVCIVRATSKWRILRLLPTVFSGEHVREPEVSLHPAKRVHLDSDEPIPLFADGEPVGTTPATVTVAPNALRVFVPTQISPPLNGR